jgi:hypothetical protein
MLDREMRNDLAIGRDRSDFADDLLEDRREGLRGMARQGEPVAEPAPREVEDILDQRCCAGDACLHLLHDELAPAAERLPLADHLNAGRQRGKRVSEVVPEHGYELLAQHRGLMFGGGHRLACVRAATRPRS